MEESLILRLSLKKDDSRTTFTVGDGKFYSRSAISDARRKRRDVSCMLVTEQNF